MTQPQLAMGTPDLERAVLDRYASASEEREECLCCPVDYDPEYLKVIPEEVLVRDYGCGNPTGHIAEGETVLDLGSGSGKACFIASQLVGAKGRVIGVDFNDSMLALARKHQPTVANRVGYSNVAFKKAKLQDLRLDRDRLDAHLRDHPVSSESDLRQLEAFIHGLREEEPLVPAGSIDVVISNCVLNLVRPEEKAQLFSEIHRVLKEGGRAVISDIVCDEPVPEHLQQDPELWSGCISGAFQEEEFLAAFENAGFWGLTLLDRQEMPWRTVEGIEFRSVTLLALKGRTGPCLDQKHAVIYRGPFHSVRDDDDHVYPRGARVAVCGRTFETLSRPPYRDHFALVTPREEISPADAEPFPCDDEILIRHPRETKGEDYRSTTENGNGACCGPDCC